MLSQVARKEKGKDWIVFLAWEPHQMNTKFRISYLDGDKEYFGPNYGSATVNTVSRKGYATQCNVGRCSRRCPGEQGHHRGVRYQGGRQSCCHQATQGQPQARWLARGRQNLQRGRAWWR